MGFDREFVLTLGSEDDCVKFINHVAGRKYDEEMWKLAQDVILSSPGEKIST